MSISKIVLWPDALLRIPVTSLGLIAMATGSVPDAIDDRGDQAANAQTAGLILAACVAGLGRDRNIFSHLLTNPVLTNPALTLDE